MKSGFLEILNALHDRHVEYVIVSQQGRGAFRLPISAFGWINGTQVPSNPRSGSLKG